MVGEGLRSDHSVFAPPDRHHSGTASHGPAPGAVALRVQIKGFSSFTQFHEQVLKVDPSGWGAQLLIDLSTVNHTSFFREPAHFTFLAEKVSGWLKEAPGSTVRLWSAGCSSGQEPYSMAIALAEVLQTHALAKVDIWASDLSLEMLKVAAGAIYTTRDVQGVSPSRLRRFFLLGRGPARRFISRRAGDSRPDQVPPPRPEKQYLGIAQRLSDHLLPQRLDLFAEEERMVLLDRLAQHLRPGGWLVMGNGEILPSVPALLHKHSPSLYQREG